MQWLAAHYGLGDSLTEKAQASAMWYACHNGHLEAVQWLGDCFDLDSKTDRAMAIIKSGLKAACGACGVSRLAVAQWLAARFGLTATEVCRADVLYTACAIGQLETVQWLVDSFDLQDLKNDRGIKIAVEGLETACIQGHLAVAQWLASRCELTAKDVQNSMALCNACTHEQLETAQWLVAHFDFAPPVVRNTEVGELGAVDALLTKALLNKQQEFALWLAAAGSYSVEELEKLGNSERIKKLQLKTECRKLVAAVKKEQKAQEKAQLGPKSATFGA